MKMISSNKNTMNDRAWKLAVHSYGSHLRHISDRLVKTERLIHHPDSRDTSPIRVLGGTYKMAKALGEEDTSFIQSIRLTIGDNGSLVIEAKEMDGYKYFLEGQSRILEYTPWKGLSSLEMSRQEILQYLDLINLFVVRRYNRKRGHIFKQTQVWEVSALCPTEQSAQIQHEGLEESRLISRMDLNKMLHKFPSSMRFVLGQHFLQVNDPKGRVNILMRPHNIAVPVPEDSAERIETALMDIIATSGVGQ